MLRSSLTMLAKKSSISRLERVPQVVVEIREDVHDRLARLQRAHAQPLAGEVGDQLVGARVLEHPAHLLLEHGWRAQLARRGDVDQLVVRDAAPQEERQPRGEREIADAIRLADGGSRRLRLAAVDELDVGEDPLQRGLDAVVEGAFFAAARTIELHQRVHVRGRRRAAERAFGERGHDRARAALFLTSGGALTRRGT